MSKRQQTKDQKSAEIQKPEQTVLMDPLLPKLRTKINEAIIYSQHFWSIYIDKCFGMAGFLDLKFKKTYIEILFFTPQQSAERQGRLFQIKSPLLKELNFSKVFQSPVVDADGIINPLDVFKRIHKLAQDEIQAYLYILENEAKRLNDLFENYPKEEKPFIRTIRIYLFNMVIEFTVDFERFPRKPIFTFSDTLKKIITEEEFSKMKVMQEWTEEMPLSIAYTIDELLKEVYQRKNLAKWNPDSQQVIVEEVQFSPDVPKVSMRLRRGQTLGVVYDPVEGNTNRLNVNRDVFKSLAGIEKPYSGQVTLFGVPSPLNPSETRKYHILDTDKDYSTDKRTVKRALLGSTDIDLSAGEWKNKSQFKGKVFEVLGLQNRLDQKIAQLTLLEKIRFQIAHALLHSARVILFSIPKGKFKKLDLEDFNLCLEKTKKMFHAVLIVHGPREIVSRCDRILTIQCEEDRNTCDSGSIDELVEKIPQQGEVLTIEFNTSDATVMRPEVLSSILKNTIFIEERKNEKFKVFSTENPDQLIIQIMNILGPYIYNFKRQKPTLADYLEFMEVQRLQN